MSTTPLGVAESIIATFHILPTIPAAAARAIQLLNEPDPDLSQVADIILSDQVIAARVIRIINSPLYKLLHEIESVKQALIYLGPQKIFEIILTSCFLELTDNRGTGGLRVQSCWEHSFGVALVSRNLAELSGLVKPELAFVSGVLHDIGEVILSQQRPELFRQALQLSLDKEIDLYDAELELFGTTHCEVGALLAEQWRFPEPFVQVILYHHDRQIELKNPLIQIVNLADRICADVRLRCEMDQPVRDNGNGGVFGEHLHEIEQQLSRLGVASMPSFRQSLLQLIEKVRETVRSIYV